MDGSTARRWWHQAPFGGGGSSPVAGVDGGGRAAGSPEDMRRLVFSAAGIYGSAAFIGLVENFVPGTPRSPIMPAVIALVLTALLFLFGRRIPRRALAVLGPFGAVLIASALAGTHGYGDGAVLYAWPVLWTAYFYGRRATLVVLASIAVAHAVALTAMPPGVGYASRWIDVMVSMTVIAIVVRSLTEGNARLLVSLASEARVDPLTGLLNRRGLGERAAVELARAQRDHLFVSVVAFDIDRFKAINDEHGHATGDRVLTQVGAVLHEQTRGSDIAARVGGEEFLMVLTGYNAQDTAAIAERTRSLVANASVAGVPVCTMSAGVDAAIAPINLDQLIADADQALYRAKREGRDRTRIAVGEAQSSPATTRSPLHPTVPTA